MNTPESSSTRALALAEQAFREAVQRAFNALLHRDTAPSIAADLTGLLASREMFPEIVGLAKAACDYRAARHTHYINTVAHARTAHEATMRDDGDTPDYLREGAEPPEPPLSVPVPPPWDFKGGEPCPTCRGACCWERCVGELAHADPADRPEAVHRCPDCVDGTDRRSPNPETSK